MLVVKKREGEEVEEARKCIQKLVGERKAFRCLGRRAFVASKSNHNQREINIRIYVTKLITDFYLAKK